MGIEYDGYECEYDGYECEYDEAQDRTVTYPPPPP